MIKIIKTKGPNSLTQYKSQPDAEYDGGGFTTVKDDIRTCLLSEQGYVCAYCMRRIVNDNLKTKIEHWQPQSIYKERQLDYSNLLACCDGGEGAPLANRTCDTRKGNLTIRYNPADGAVDIGTKIKFKSSGKVESTDSSFNNDINSTLNLNNPRLVKNRAIVLEEIQFFLSMNKGRRTKNQIQGIIDHWESKINGKYKEYYGVAIYDLKVRKSRAPR